MLACALLKSKLYCHGGYMPSPKGEDILSTLDVFANNGGPVQDLNSQWSYVNPSNPSGIVVDRRDYSQSVAMPDGVRLLINGGYNGYANPLVQKNIAYNAESNAWELLANYNELVWDSDRQM